MRALARRAPDPAPRPRVLPSVDAPPLRAQPVPMTLGASSARSAGPVAPSRRVGHLLEHFAPGIANGPQSTPGPRPSSAHVAARRHPAEHLERYPEGPPLGVQLTRRQRVDLDRHALGGDERRLLDDEENPRPCLADGVRLGSLHRPR